MPEFVLDTGTGPTWRDLGDLERGFIEAAFFCETCPGVSSADWNDKAEKAARAAGRSDGSIPCDSDVDDLTPESVEWVKAVCAEFEAKAAADIAEACNRPGYDLQRAGNDLYYTRAGHGVGFWDRSELDAGGLGDRLSDAAGRAEVNLWADVDNRRTRPIRVSFL